jgi:hypothetical protein
MRIHVKLFVLCTVADALAQGAELWVSNQMERFLLSLRAHFYRRPVNATAFYLQWVQQKILVIGRYEIVRSALVNKIKSHLTLSMFRNTFRWSGYGVIHTNLKSGFGGLEDVCWPLVPKFAGSNPAEAVGFFRAKKSPARLPSEGK